MIVVNATALDRSGALSILKQFISNIPLDDLKWLIFISDKVSIENEAPNLTLVPIKGVKSMHKRLWWDAVGLNKWLKAHNIMPKATVSLQNTGFRVSGKDIPMFIYYHQSIPFYPYKWNVFRKEHRRLWFYKNIYPLFVRLFLTKKTKIFVQLEFIKNGFIDRFRHDPNMVKVYSPAPPDIPSQECHAETGASGLKFFYPATDFFYKNHEVIIKALEESNLRATLYLTTVQDSKNASVKHLGPISFYEVCTMYHSCDCLLFPSYIETYGLPLIEAASTGMPIIAADLPYAREVLTGYEGVTFVSHTDPKAWADAMQKIEKGKRFMPLDVSGRPSWKDLFECIKLGIFI